MGVEDVHAELMAAVSVRQGLMEEPQSEEREAAELVESRMMVVL